jgi:hypothetical protein
MAVYFKIIIDSKEVFVFISSMVLYSRFVLVPFNSQTAMCKSLSPFFIYLR